jgi:uncharacterized membrane protein YgdD (TMEM256/DUF423 family)
MNHTKNHRLFGSILALTAIILGAFGAHALKDTLNANGSSDTWQTAVQYQMWHALALILLSAITSKQVVAKLIGPCFLIGTVLFSGSLYALALDGPRWLGPVTPLGGLCLIIGWGLFAYSTIKEQP